MARTKAENLNIGYCEQGAGDTVVFLHGVGSDKAVWDAQIEHFAALNYRAVALDYPGYGESDLPPADLNREQIADCIFGALDALGIIAAAHIVGLSMGGVIALEMWLREPERIRSVVLADTFAKHPEGDAILERSLEGAATLGMHKFAERRIAAVFAPGAAPALKRAFVENMSRINPRSYAWASRAVWTADYRADLSSIRTPTLVLVGEHDALTPVALSEELQKGIQGARLRVIPSAGHLSNIDNAAAFNEAVAKFLDLNQVSQAQL